MTKGSKPGTGPATKGGQTTIVTPEDSDILFGRGGHVNHNPANQHYLALVSARKDKYLNCKKVDKASIAWDIIRELREQNPTPRFLRKDYSTGLWHIVKDSEVRRKISQCLRERATPVITSTKKKSRRKSTKRIQQAATINEDTNAQRVEPWSCLEEVPSQTIETLGVQTQDTSLPEAVPSQTFDTLSVQAQDTSLQVEPIPEAFLRAESQEASQAQLVKQPLVHDEEEDFVHPQMPKPVPFSSKAETSNSRVWSDFLTGSFASFTPFDSATGGGTAWENLLGPSSLPQLCEADDDDSYLPESLTSDEDSKGGTFVNKPSTFAQRTSSGQDCEISCWGECATATTCKPKDHPVSDGSAAAPTSVDSFFNCDAMSFLPPHPSSTGSCCSPTRRPFSSDLPNCFDFVGMP